MLYVLQDIGSLTTTLTDTGRGKTSSTIQHRGKRLKTAIQDKGVTPCTLQSTETKTPKPTDHVFVFCNEKIRLYHASKHGQLGRVKSIIRQDREDINCREKKTKRTPVMAAARMGQGKVFDFLVSQGCLLSGVDYHNNNILHLACKGGNIGIVSKLVVDERFDIESRGFSGKIPIMVAAEFGKRKVFDFLMNRGSNMKIVNYYNDTILHVACFRDHVEMMKYILSLNMPGIDVESRGYRGRTPIMIAAKYGNREVFDFLMNRGSNMNIVDYDNNTILHVACYKDHVKMVSYILSFNVPGTDVESRGSHGKTPIMVAAKYGNREVFVFLVKRGSNMNIVDYDNNTILHVACHKHQVEMVQYILSLNIPGIDVAGRGYNGC